MPRAARRCGPKVFRAVTDGRGRGEHDPPTPGWWRLSRPWMVEQFPALGAHASVHIDKQEANHDAHMHIHDCSRGEPEARVAAMRRRGGRRADAAPAAVAQAAPTGTLDQQQTQFRWVLLRTHEDIDYAAAQTFTAGPSGLLDQVDLRLRSMEGPATVEIHAVDSSGAPGSTVLASTTVAPVDAETWVEAAFSSPATVTAGTKYAIVVRSAAPGTG